MSNSIKKIVTGFSTIALAMSMVFVAAPVADAATAGGVYKTTDGTVWFVTSSMQRRPFTSWGAFLSYGFLSQSQIMDADASVTALPSGSFIAPQDGRIFCATETKGTDVSGECSLITAGKKAAFTSAAVFTGQGYSFARAYYGDSSFLEKTSNIDNASAQHRPGTLINNNGTVQLVVSGGLWGVPSMDVFNSWGWSFADVVPANSADVLLSQTGVIPARMAGQLVPTASSNPGPGTGTGDCNLDGSTGSISTNALSKYSGEEVGEGENEVPVMAFEVEADTDSDVAVTSVKVEFDENGAGSTDLEDYASNVTVMMNGEEVGSANVDDFTEGATGTWTKNISLDCAEISADDTQEFTIAVDGNNVIDSADQDEAWLVDVTSVRFEDGDGVTSTENTDADAGSFPDLQKSFTWTSFAGASDIELNVSLTDDADDINDAHVLDIDDTDDTEDVEILAFTLENKGDVDVTVNDIPVVITTTGETLEAVLVQNATLWVDNDQISSDTIPSDPGNVLFEDLDLNIDAGESVDFVVAVDIQDTTGAADNGDTVQATVTTAGIDADDSEGDQLQAGDLTGSAAGGTNGVFDRGIMVDYVSSTASVTPSGIVAVPDTANFTIVFDVTAFDGDAYVDASPITDEAGGATYQDILVNGAVGTGVLTSDADTAASSTYLVREGQTERFTLSVAGNGTNAFANLYLESVLYATTAIDGDTVYNFNMGDFHTSSVYAKTN